MTPNQAEMLSAFFDGESVDPQMLAAGLQEPDAMAFLVECARLRVAVQEDESRPREEFSDRLRDIVAAGDRRRRRRQRLRQFAMAASLALAAATGGFGARAWMENRRPAAVAPAMEARQRQAEVPGTAPVPIPVTVAPPPPVTAGAPRGEPARRAVPSPGLRMHFDEWRNSVL